MNEKGQLSRRLGLPLLVLYGTGITIGAGIYVLIGTVAGHAGAYAPWSFAIAAIVMAFTVASYAELSTRYPVSAGEAAYVAAAFGSKTLSAITGLVTLVIGIVSSAAVALGAAGYIRQFVDVPAPVIVVATILVLGAVACWGIFESALLAGLFTLVEVGGLIVIIFAAVADDLPFAQVLLRPPPMELNALSAIGFASLLAFFAFIGFEDLANVAEEAREPQRNLPLAMALTLAISSLLYILVAAIAVTAIAPEKLAASPAPLSDVYVRLTSAAPLTISAIAIFATLNTILAQMTMASRVVYGMAKQGSLPTRLASVHPVTATPVLATVLNVIVTALLALVFPFEKLAEGTSLATLVVFALINLALLRIRFLRVQTAHRHVKVPIWAPAIGLVTCLALIASSLLG